MIFNRYGDPRTMMRNTRDAVCPPVIREMSSNSVTAKASRRPRVTASLFSCGVMRSSLGIGMERLRRKNADLLRCKARQRHASPAATCGRRPSGEQCSDIGLLLYDVDANRMPG